MQMHDQDTVRHRLVPSPPTCASSRRSAHRSSDVVKGFGHRKASGTLQVNAAHRLAHDEGDFEKPQAQGRKARARQSGKLFIGASLVSLLADRSPDLEEQPISQRMQNQTKAVGLEAVTADAVAFQRAFEFTDVLLTSPPAAVADLVEQASGELVEIGDHEPRIVALKGDLGLADNVARLVPGAGLVIEVCKHTCRLANGQPASSGLSQRGFELGLQYRISGHADEIADLAVGLVELLDAAIDAGAAKAGVGAHHHRAVGPVQGLEEYDDTLDPLDGVLGVMSVSGPKNHRDQLAGLIVEDKERMEHMAAMKAAKRQFLLSAVALESRRIDVESDFSALVIEAANPAEDELPLHRLDMGRGGRVFQPRQRRLRRQCAPIGRAAACGLQDGVVAKPVGVVLVGISKGNLDDTLEDLLLARMHHPGGVAPIGHQVGDGLADAESVFGLPEQNSAAIGRDIVGAELNVDGQLGLEIEAGLRVTLCHEERGWLVTSN